MKSLISQIGHPYGGEWFYPPRTQMRIPYSGPALAMWKRYSDAVAQYKMNGTNVQVKVHPDHSTIELWTRHRANESMSGTPILLKNYDLPNSLRDAILGISPSGSYTIYNAELMHAKTKTIKDTLYFFDLLVWAGEHLIGIPYGERYEIMQSVIGDKFMPIDMTECRGDHYIARNIMVSEWDQAWTEVQSSHYCEGLVLKRTGPTSNLSYGNSQINNSGFMCRIRKPTKMALY